MKNTWSKFAFKIFLLSIFGLISIVEASAFNVKAQAPVGSEELPVNISHSGLTSSPQIVVDSEGVVHVIWLDEYAGTVYSYFNNISWSQSKKVELPFGKNKPLLKPGSNSWIYTVWIDDHSNLSASAVKSSGFGNSGQWQGTVLLADSVVSVDLCVDDKGILHIIYIRNVDIPEFPAGVYYQNSQNNGANWSKPKLIYQSPYFRGLAPEKTNVKISASEVGQSTYVFVVWDNPLRKQILSTRSTDGGSGWDLPQEISKPTVEGGSVSPHNIEVIAHKMNIMLLWQDGESSTGCTQNYQVSHDAGDTWVIRNQLLRSIKGCPDENQFLYASDDQFILSSKMNQQIYLSAFSGDLWSNAIPQDELRFFPDPETQNLVFYGCVQMAISNDASTLYSVGCDLNFTTNSQTYNPAISQPGNSIKGDIWFIKRSISSVADWFAKSSSWSPLIKINSSGSKIYDSEILADSQNQLHALWIQMNVSTDQTKGATGETKKVLFYSSLIDGLWSPPEVVLESTEGDIQQFTASVTRDDQLIVLWHVGDLRELRISKVHISEAISASNWLSPSRISIKYPSGLTPELKIDQKGIVYVVYTIPLNEERGVYIVKSADQGKTWTEPVRVFDGVGAGWEMVDNPRMTISDDGLIHLIWTRSTTPLGAGTQALFYSRSNDEGATWSAPVEVESQPFEWSDLLSTAGGEIFRFWKNELSGRSMLWYQNSSDSGTTWSQPNSISSFAKILEAISISTDFDNNPNIILIDNTGSGIFSLKHYAWQDDSWVTLENVNLEGQFIHKTVALSTVISLSKGFSLIFSGEEITQGTNQNFTYPLYFSQRTTGGENIDGSPVITPSQVTPAETPNPTINSNTNPTSIPTKLLPTTNPHPLGNANELTPISQPNPWKGLMIGGGLAILLTIIVFGIVVLKTINSRK